MVGYTLVSALPQLGDDPRCVLGWSASLKTRALLAPLFLTSAVSLLAAAVAACNSGHARVRPELKAELRSRCRGHAVFTVLHTVNHGLALLCYVLLSGDDSQEAGIAYSLFQVRSHLLSSRPHNVYHILHVISHAYYAIGTCILHKPYLP